MTLSVIILNYNVCYFLEQCLLSVQEALANIDSEIIVVDNNSEDGSRELVLKKFPLVTWVQNEENVGFSKANNQGVAIASGKYICILNPDTAVGKETFTKILNFTAQKDDFGAIGVKLIDGIGNFLPESKRNIPRPKVALLKILGLKSKKNDYYANHIEEDKTGEASILVGAFMFMKKSRYEEVGGFDEDYFMYGEDIDLSYKLLKAGYVNYYFGETTVLHYKGESTNKDKEYLKRFYGAMHIFHYKHFKPNGIFKIFVTIGVFCVRFLNTIRTVEEQYLAKPVKYYILSDNMDVLKQLTAVRNEKLKSISKSAVTDGGIYNSQLIFDANYISYTQIFKTMQSLKDKGNTFRIRPINCDFIIGSDSSRTKGEITTF